MALSWIKVTFHTVPCGFGLNPHQYDVFSKAYFMDRHEFEAVAGVWGNGNQHLGELVHSDPSLWREKEG